jgi:hypothetical protein
MKPCAFNNANRDVLALAGFALPNVAYKTSTGVMFVVPGAGIADWRQRFAVHRQWHDGSITAAGPRDGFHSMNEAKAFIQQKDKDGFL